MFLWYAVRSFAFYCLFFGAFGLFASEFHQPKRQLNSIEKQACDIKKEVDGKIKAEVESFLAQRLAPGISAFLKTAPKKNSDGTKKAINQTVECRSLIVQFVQQATGKVCWVNDLQAISGVSQAWAKAFIQKRLHYYLVLYLNVAENNALFYSDKSLLRDSSCGPLLSYAYNLNQEAEVKRLLALGACPCHTIMSLTPYTRPDLTKLFLRHVYFVGRGNKALSDKIKNAGFLAMARAIKEDDLLLAAILAAHGAADINMTYNVSKTLLESYCAREHFFARDYMSAVREPAKSNTQAKNDLEKGFDAKTVSTIHQLLKRGCDPLQYAEPCAIISGREKPHQMLSVSRITPYDHLRFISIDCSVSQEARKYAASIVDAMRQRDPRLNAWDTRTRGQFTDISIVDHR